MESSNTLMTPGRIKKQIWRSGLGCMKRNWKGEIWVAINTMLTWNSYNKKRVKENLQHQESTIEECIFQYPGILLQEPSPISYIPFSVSFFPSVFECGIAQANLLFATLVHLFLRLLFPALSIVLPSSSASRHLLWDYPCSDCVSFGTAPQPDSSKL